MLAFAGNSLLYRMALRETSLDAASFTTLRLLSGVLVLWLIVEWRGGRRASGGTWFSGSALFVYAAGFSFAYVSLAAGTGALLLFGAVQTTMILYGLWTGERLGAAQWLGLLLALGGVAGLLLPGVSAPPLGAATLMLCAGVAWGIYSLRGRRVGGPTQITAGNFLRAIPFTLGLTLVLIDHVQLDIRGVVYAVLSGALASGLGYAVWYAALPALSATTAATAQLSVPLLAAAAGIVFLGEALTPRLALTSLAILGGIALVVRGGKRQRELPHRPITTASDGKGPAPADRGRC